MASGLLNGPQLLASSPISSAMRSHSLPVTALPLRSLTSALMTALTLLPRS